MKIDVSGENAIYSKYVAVINPKTGLQIEHVCMVDEELQEYEVFDFKDGKPVVRTDKNGNKSVRRYTRRGACKIVLMPEGVPVAIAQMFYVEQAKVRAKIHNMVAFAAASINRRAVNY